VIGAAWEHCSRLGQTWMSAPGSVIMNDLARKSILGFAQLIMCLGVLLFAPAWTLDFWQAWVYLFIFAASAALITEYLWNKDRALLERRVKAGPTAEREKSQKYIQLFAAIAFIGIMILPSLDHRFAWSDVPLSVTIVGDVLVAFGFLIIFLVFKENTFTAATIEVTANQQVISTGPYALVRHPMYAGALVMLFGTPIALGSWWGLLVFVLLTLVIIWRLIDEERLLSQSLPGYLDYKQKVRYRLVPFVW
jgi:protein-S-isoprenylcysteine O-methyltransferase Ste14